MKKKPIIIIILIITVSLYIFGWNGKKTKVTEDKWNNKESEKETETVDFQEINQLSQNDIVTCGENNCISTNNPFFYKNDNVYLNATITYRDLEEEIVRDGTLNMKLVKNYENGDLFKLSVDDKEKIQECLSEDRLNVYFYVTEDEIYRLWSYIYQDEEVIRFYNDDDLIVKYLDTDDKLIANGELVCCKESVPDKLDWPESGSHVDIIQQNDQVEYDRVDLNANGDRQFYERFIWEKGKGLVEFRSGFRVEADILYIENIKQQSEMNVEE